MNKPAYIELFELSNTSDKPCHIDLGFVTGGILERMRRMGFMENIAFRQKHYKERKVYDGTIGQNFHCSDYTGRKPGEEKYQYSSAYELLKREKFVQEVFGNLVLETPNDTVNEEFAFAKIRAAESIYDTKGGLMHGPGGVPIMPAIWANDQAEYVNPFFPYLGNLEGNESAINSTDICTFYESGVQTHSKFYHC